MKVDGIFLYQSIPIKSNSKGVIITWLSNVLMLLINKHYVFRFVTHVVQASNRQDVSIVLSIKMRILKEIF